jgi:hypothetical protein
MAERFSIRQIGDNAFVVLDEKIIIAAVWKAPAPFHDWYWGRVAINVDTYDLTGFGVEDTKADAVNACCMEENRKYFIHAE